MIFNPSRQAASTRLAEFTQLMGRDFAFLRNYDRRPQTNVSRPSPHLHHRMVSEGKVLAAPLSVHSPSAAEKFIHEVYWRTYGKGRLDQRPPVWTTYRAGLEAALNLVQTESGLRREWKVACRSDTGIDRSDAWARE